MQDLSKTWAFTPTTSLPESQEFPPSHIAVLDECFKVMDDLVDDPHASERFRDLFTVDGVWKTPSATFTGIEEVAVSGSKWEPLRSMRSMRHWVLRVYVQDREGRELMLLGRIRIESKDGNVRDVHFGARVVMELVSEGEVRVKFFQGWSSNQ